MSYLILDGVLKSSQVFDYVELVVEDNHLIEQKRFSGENTVSINFIHMFISYINHQVFLLLLYKHTLIYLMIGWYGGLEIFYVYSRISFWPRYNCNRQ